MFHCVHVLQQDCRPVCMCAPCVCMCVRTCLSMCVCVYPQVSGVTDAVYLLGPSGERRDDMLHEAESRARDAAVAAGAVPDTCAVVEQVCGLTHTQTHTHTHTHTRTRHCAAERWQES